MHRISSASFLLAPSLFVGGVMAVHDVLVARQGTSSTSSSTASASTIPLPPDLYFQTIPQAVTCKPLTFSWFYNGLNGVFTFEASNAGISQADTPPPLTTLTTSSSSLPISPLARRAVPTGVNPGPLSVPIASNIAGSKSEFTWSAVSVPQGWYVINATMESPQYTVASSAFYVHTGTDTSCLVSATSSAPSPGSTGSTSATPVSASSVSGAKKGVVIGVAVGVAALAAALFSAWIFYLHRRSKKSPAPGSGGGEFPKGLAHRWNGLASTDSRGLTGGGVGRRFSHGHRPYRTDSMGSIQMTPSEEAVAAEKNSEGKFDDESTSTGHGLALSYLPVLPHNGQTPRAKASAVGRTFSTSSSASEHGFQSQNGHHTSAPVPMRRPSVHDSIPARRSTESTTYPPASPTRKNSTHAPPSKSTAQYNMMYPSSPTSPQNDNDNNNNAMSPTGSASPGEGGARLTNRQSLKRKPVPAYDPNEDPSPPAVSQVPPVASPVFLPPNPSSTPDSSMGNINITNGGAHYATRNQLEQDPNQPSLIHKSSFGPGGVEGKPLHYLIPDMPMPLRG